LPRNVDLFVGREATPPEAKEMIRAYWASSSWADWNLGRVLAELDQLGLRQNTVVVVWGDHGYHLGEKGKWSKHQSLFEVGTRVPFVIAAPGAKGNGKPCPRVVESLGLYPTLCELCGLPTPAGLEGRSLKPLLDDPNGAWDHPAFMVAGNAGKLRGTAVRTDRFRYVEYQTGGAMLFDEAADPSEMNNLADDPRFARGRAELAGRIKVFWASPGRSAEPRRTGAEADRCRGGPVPLGSRHLPAPPAVRPIAVVGHQARLDRVAADVLDDSLVLLVGARPVVEPLVLPKPPAVLVHQLPRLVARPSFELFQVVFQPALAKLEEQMHMRRHDDVLDHVPDAAVTEGDRLRDHAGHGRLAQVRGVLGPVQPRLHFREHAPLDRQPAGTVPGREPTGLGR
jgi:hypothetical protein